MHRELDALARTSISSSPPPEIRTPADQLAMRLAVDHAERLLAEDPGILAEGSQLLPASPHDYDFDNLWRHLLDNPTTQRMGSPTT